MSTTIGSYGREGGWCAVAVLELDGESVLVDQQHRRPDDPEARGVVIARYERREEAEADAAARVLALGGQLGAGVEQLAESPVCRQALEQLRRTPRNGAWLCLEGRDGERVDEAQARRMFGAELERYLHVFAGAAR